MPIRNKIIHFTFKSKLLRLSLNSMVTDGGRKMDLYFNVGLLLLCYPRIYEFLWSLGAPENH